MQPEQQAAPVTEQAEDNQDLVLPEQQPVQWQAPEYLQDHRSPWWVHCFLGCDYHLHGYRRAAY